MESVSQETITAIEKQVASETQLTTVPEAPAAIVPEGDGNDEFNIVAKYPYQMKAAQGRLIAWAVKKIEETTAEVNDLGENLDIAIKNNWQYGAIERALNRAQKRLYFYIKARLALEAGYCIVPDFPVDLFAIRTKKKKPKALTTTSSYGFSETKEQQAQTLPAGHGRYVSDEPEIYQRDAGQKDGMDLTQYFAEHFRGVEFPFALAKPAILKDVERALADKFFDELGALPGSRAKGDPIIIGRIKHPDKGKAGLTFLVSWFIDLRDMP